MFNPLKMKEIEKGVKISLSCCFIFFSYMTLVPPQNTDDYSQMKRFL